MKIYIRRKSGIGYHGSYYSNLVKYTQKLMQIDLRKTGEAAALIEKIKNESILADREWLLAQLGHIATD